MVVTDTTTAAAIFDDLSHRYAPDTVLIVNPRTCARGGLGGRRYPVVRTISYPPGQHPKGCPIRAEVTAVELITDQGSGWYGCARAYINAELRFVLVGHNSRDEVRAKWAIVPEGLTDGRN